MDPEVLEARRAEPTWDALRERRVLSRVLEARERARRSRTRRGVALGVALAAAAGLVVVWTLGPDREVPVAAVPEPTPVERVEVPGSPRLALADGSEVELAEGTRVEVEIQSTTELRLVQHGGEARYVVSHRPERAFVVSIGDVEVRVRGTRFVVRVTTPSVEVEVEEGRVEVARGTDVRVLGAGEALRLSRVTVSMPSSEVEPETAPAETIEAPHRPRPPEPAVVAPPIGMTERLAAADAARRDGRLEEAARSLRAAVADHPEDGRALTALFSLARVERARGRDAAAAQAFEDAYAQDLDAILAEDALAEAAVSWAAAGRADRAASAATRYLARFPDGQYAARVRPLVE